MTGLLATIINGGLKFLTTKQSNNKTVLGGAITVVLVYVLNLMGVSIPLEVSVSAGIIIAALIGLGKDA